MSTGEPSERALIEPRTLKGFRDFLPQTMIPRERLIETAKRVYRSFGFAPIDTPALEYLDVLTGKGGDESDKQLYKFEDPGGRMVGMRFDLTVPLARFVAQHSHELGIPFKRYHIATVWRGENTQRGRYREFMQADFDTIGSTAIAADIETALVIDELMRAIGFERFVIRLNNRAVLNGLLQILGLADKATAVLQALDKLAKIKAAGVSEELTSLVGLTTQQANEVLRLASLEGTNDQVLTQLDQLLAGNELGQSGVGRLRDILQGFESGGGAAERLQLDISIARGLDYYTGPIYETFLQDLPDIGSVCSGGRYDDLASMFTKQQLPGIGASLGLDRLLAAQEELGLIQPVQTTAPVLIAFFAADRLNGYLRLASWIRAAGIGAELYPEPKKLGQQLKYANRKGFRFVVIVGDDEWQAGRGQLKDLQSGEQRDLSLADNGGAIVLAIKETLVE